MWTMRMVCLTGAAALTVATMTPAARAQTMMVPLSGDPPVEFYTDLPQADPGDDPANWPARQNVVDSYRYEQLVHTDPAFRNARVDKECGPIHEPDLFQQCVATFR